MSPMLETETYLIDLLDDEGEPYSGRLTGMRLDDNEVAEVALFALSDGRHVIYHTAEFRYEDITDYIREKLATNKRIERFREGALQPSEARIIDL